MCDLEMTILDRPKAMHLGCHGTTIALLTESTTLSLARIHSHSEILSCVSSVSLISIFNPCVPFPFALMPAGGLYQNQISIWGAKRGMGG